ncbi:MAG: c-type cytochrome biogenesis protein CcmI [Pseudomonadota bacterium]
MVVWLSFSVLLVLTLVVLARPLLRSSPGEVGGGEDVAVYADQLREVDSDEARGLIETSDAATARNEIARRLLRAKRAQKTLTMSTRRSIIAMGLLVVFVPAFTVGAYTVFGSPYYGDQPLAARLQPVTPEELERMLAVAERRLANNPEDGIGWASIAPVYQRLNRFAEAAEAYAKANALLGEEAGRLSGHAESLTFANAGEVTADAKALFEKALEMEPGALRPSIFLAIAARQAGNFDEAGERWRTLLATSNGTEPWLQIANAEFMRMGGDDPAISRDLSPPPRTPSAQGQTPPQAPAEGAEAPAQAPAQGAPLRGPTADQVAAAAALPEEAQQAMVDNMVSRLATRLASDGGSVEEWARLINAYRVLGRDEDAKEALESALASLDEPEAAQLKATPGLETLLP